MAKLRVVESELTLPLEPGLVVSEGVDDGLRVNVREAHQCTGSDDYIREVALYAPDNPGPKNTIVYSLGREAALCALATFSWQRSAVTPARTYRFDYHSYDQENIVDPDQETAFLRAVHDDLENGLQPPARRYEGQVWSSVKDGDLAKQALYEQIGYTKTGLIIAGERVFDRNPRTP